MADMNAWNSLQQRRGAIAALTELRETVDGWFMSDAERMLHEAVLKQIGDMLAEIEGAK